MLLAIDCGNTNIVFALYDGEVQAANWRISTDAKRSADEYFVMLTHLMQIKEFPVNLVTEVIIACVVPEVQPKLQNMALRGFGVTPLVVGAVDVDLGIDVNIDQPGQAGADRLVNAVAARAFHDLPAIVVDFGTATTIDLIGVNGAYEGGIIAPGVNLSVEALYVAAARLPRLAVEPWAADMPVLGKNTLAAMHSGIFWGYVSMVDGLIARLRIEIGADFPVIATGGLAPLFADHMPVISIVDSDLTLKGLLRINAQSQKLKQGKI